jgi:hypothetical protein
MQQTRLGGHNQVMMPLLLQYSLHRSWLLAAGAKFIHQRQTSTSYEHSVVLLYICHQSHLHTYAGLSRRSNLIIADGFFVLLLLLLLYGHRRVDCCRGLLSTSK